MRYKMNLKWPSATLKLIRQEIMIWYVSLLNSNAIASYISLLTLCYVKKLDCDLVCSRPYQLTFSNNFNMYYIEYEANIILAFPDQFTRLNSDGTI